ncbi:glycosyltransferase family 2 protein [Zhongshania aliphaticivorans]|uniref:glycosyltransferase family 2 protein n=1 Tax=Zhongshania aliphaticivorans TaxID=1470434 RepID=UPI0012E44EA6|nr:glycosyltransferase family 2 protein [Zhongshania aliphaticivorans]CAA0100614.1 Undecaprenyl-phosphate 4-deoxy-4-formamido-L-arabinose transferase [Zhongshania aliphaticivorans]
MTNVSSNFFAPCALIPVYNHSLVLANTCKTILAKGLAIILVDDGSNEPCKKIIQSIISSNEKITLIEHSTNRGKGAAIKTGITAAQQLGFSHAIQVDADGQHNLADIERFIGAANKAPNALILGYPAYDESVPRHRYYARYLTHIWIWINTLSTSIKDTMCGFRVYPIQESSALIAASTIGDRMEFDSEFVVMWYWSGLSIAQHETDVRYPQDGISHFRLLKDNLLISKMHAKLFFGMLWRLPKLLQRKLVMAGK